MSGCPPEIVLGGVLTEAFKGISPYVLLGPRQRNWPLFFLASPL